MSELAPPASASTRRSDRLIGLRRLEEQIAVLQARARLEVAALYREDRTGMSQRYTADELALLWRRSPRSARNRLEQALMFADFPAVHARIEDGSWLLDHADAVLDELVGSGLDHEAQQQVLDLVLSRRGGRTPWELRAQVRTAIVVLFPAHAADKAAKAEQDRDVRTYQDSPGAASLLAFGPASAVAAMMASLDTLTWPPAPDDTRTAAQRRFDALYDLVCGRAQPGQWQAQVLVSLATVEGHDELPGEIPGFGPVPAPMARELLTGASIRRVVVDDHGQLVAVDAQVHRPDQPAPTAAPAPAVPSPRTSAEQHAPAPVPARRGSEHDQTPEPVEPDPDAPTPDELAWLESHTDRTELYATHDDASEQPASAAYRRPRADDDAGPRRTPLVPSRWSPETLNTALQRLRTDPLNTLDLHTDRYAVPPRLKRHLVLRERNACRRIHQGQVIGVGDWDRLFDDDTH